MTSRTRILSGALLVLVLVAVAIETEASPPSQETSVDQCLIESMGDDTWYTCNGGKYKIIHTSSESVNIVCQDTKLNCSRFRSIGHGGNSTLTRLQMTSCALDEPISCFLAKLNFADVERLRLIDPLTPLTARHLEGLRAITFVYYERTGYYCPPDAPFLTTSNKKPSCDGAVPVSLTVHSQTPALRVEEAATPYLIVPEGPLPSREAPLLQKLDLTSDSISDVPRGFFRDLPSLDELLLRNNSIVDINNDTFTGMLDPLLLSFIMYTSRENLRKYYNMMSSAAGLNKVTWLNLDQNRISELRGGALSPLRGLEGLSIEDNLLTRLHDGFLQGLDQLKQVRTPLVLDPRAFANLRSLSNVMLEECRLQELPSTIFQGSKAIQMLNLRNNQLKRLHPEVFSNQTEMTELDLSKNQLTNIDGHLFLTLIKLVELDLSYNQLENFLITDVVTVATVDLSYNNISTVFLNPVSFMEQKTPVKFILDHNPLNCDCHIYSFAKLATFYNYAQYFSLWNARCNAPVRLKGTRLTQVPLDEFECQVKCPSVCNCTDVPHKDIVKAVCSGVSTEPSNITNKVSLKFTRKPKSLQNLSFGKVLKMDLSGLHLNEIDFVTLPKTVKVLNLSDNNLNYLPKDVLNRNISFALSNNPLFCDCWNQEHVTELQQNSANIMDYPTLRCKDDMLLSQVDVQRICDTRKFTVIGISLTVLGVVFILTVVVIYRYSFELKVYISKYFPYLLPEEKYDASKKFDVFISYAHQDEDFVRDTLLPKLEGPPINVKTCIHSRDWIAGEMIPYNIAKSVEESRRTVIVLSENFLRSIWGLLEFRAAHVQATKEGNTRVVVILLEDVMNKEDLNEEIKAYLRTNTYIKWGEPWFWEKLAYALPKRGKIVDSREEKRLQSITNELAKTELEMQQNNED
ncbi:hypothetical protein K1T71_014958 [Dendrolimus kikuchii]|nr:hypothetical protein K1T71_014958 [Dendrolimus kikuchii]